MFMKAYVSMCRPEVNVTHCPQLLCSPPHVGQCLTESGAHWLGWPPYELHGSAYLGPFHFTAWDIALTLKKQSCKYKVSGGRRDGWAVKHTLAENLSSAPSIHIHSSQLPPSLGSHTDVGRIDLDRRRPAKRKGMPGVVAQQWGGGGGVTSPRSPSAT